MPGSMDTVMYFANIRFRYSEDDVVGYLVQILQGVEYLHNRRVLHLDLKPDNIMVTSFNAIKIVDLGSAQSFNPLNLKQQDSGTGTGTLEYMGEDKHQSVTDYEPLNLVYSARLMYMCSIYILTSDHTHM